MWWQILLLVALLGGAVAFIGDTFTTRAEAKYQKVLKAAESERAAQNVAWVDYTRQEIATADARMVAAEAARDAFKTELDKKRSANVTPFAVKSCVLTVGVVRQHNAAASGRAGIDVQPGAAFAVDAPAGIGIDRYSGAVEANYATCLKWIDRAKAWQHQAATSCRKWNDIYHRTDPCPPEPAGADGQPANAREIPDPKGK